MPPAKTKAKKPASAPKAKKPASARTLLKLAEGTDADAFRDAVSRAETLAIEDRNGIGLFATAVTRRDPAVALAFCRALIDAKADVEHGGSRASRPLCCAASMGHLEVVRALLDAGADVRAASGNARTALHAAAANGHAAVCDELLARGADPNARNDDNSSPMHYALVDPAPNRMLAMHAVTPAEEAARLQLFQRLLDGGGNARWATPSGWTLLHWTAAKGRVDAMKVLLERGADANASSEKRRTPLHAAAQLDRADAVALLLEAGADPALRDGEGHTAREVAEAKGATAALGLLQ